MDHILVLEEQLDKVRANGNKHGEGVDDGVPERVVVLGVIRRVAKHLAGLSQWLCRAHNR